ncbi:O-succinylhomoserine sulfhydrylase [Algiphilus sp.]|uniref:O-succinylhomoserine sulfhydrylase n=1 Tax=Algiphilus sp. TaxID=1872431 RepID=UPI0025B92FD9|nr:O-succinylhomoserine sulfhydrylase [Algiphilus sp.]MCK5770258.1 O-succinylhomoserine sulfhydrylase [Algiphilus sp.]
MAESSDTPAAPRPLGAGTLGVRGATLRTPWREHSPAIFATSSFVFDSAEQAAAVFAEREAGYVYSRFTNPTVEAFEKRLAVMEGAEAGIGTASGMSAILVLCMALLSEGDHVVASRTLFGSTISLFENILSRFGLCFSYVDPCDLDAWREAVTPSTRMLFVESPTNPLCEVVDIAGLAEIARAADARLVVDNCFLTPVFQQPIALGAHLVMHSATKYLDGQGRCVGGAIVGDQETVGGTLFRFMRTCGPSMSPFNAWSFLKGLETLQVRMEAHETRARQVAEALVAEDAVRHVYYPGLPDHPQHALASRQQGGFGGIVSFDLVDQAAAWRFIDRLQLASITANLGDTRTTVTHPASTTHLRIGPEARARAGIGDGLVRIAVGLEDAADLVDDIRGALR